MKTSYILLGLGALVVLYLVFSKSSGLPKSSSTGPTYTGTAGLIAAGGTAAAGLGKGIGAIIDSLGNSDSTTTE